MGRPLSFSLILLFIFCSFVPSNAQNIGFSGYVRDLATGESLIGATVYAYPQRLYTITSKQGYFYLNLPKSDSVQLEFRFIGYMNRLLTIKPGQDSLLTVYLKEDTLLLESVHVNENSFMDKDPSMLSISMDQIRSMPTLAGEVDVMRAFQMMPGVQAGREGTSGLYVRGGSPDQNLIMLDNVPLYYINHIGGFFSTFDPNAVKDVRLVKGGFPARYGGRLSAIVDVTLKEGDKKTHRSAFDLGTMSTRFSHEGPIKKDTSSFLISVRRANLDVFSVLASLLSSGGDFLAGYTFYDINAKYHHKLGKRDQLFFTVYHGFDKIYSRIFDNENDPEFQYKSRNKVKWGSTLGAIRWNHLFSDNWVSDFTLYHNRYEFSITSESSRTDRETEQELEYLFSAFRSGIKDLGLKMDNEIFQTNDLLFRFGAGLTYHYFDPGKFETNQKLENESEENYFFGSSSLNVLELSAYFESETRIFDGKVKLLPGIHFNTFHLVNKSYLSIQPRFVATYNRSKTFQINGSVASMAQFLHLLSNNGVGVPIDIWVPSTEEISPQESMVYSLGMKKDYRQFLKISMDVYYKKMSNLIEFKEGASFFSNNAGWSENIETHGSGRSYGLEVLLEKDYGKTNGWLAYTLSKNERQFDELNNGNYFPYRFDRRHSLSLNVNHQLNARKSLAFSWQYASGEAITLAVQQYQLYAFDLNNEFLLGFQYLPAHQYSSRNGYRMPDYHRLDVAYNIVKETKKAIKTLRLGIYNMYNRQNPYFLYFDKDKTGKVKLYQASLFPIIPSISWTYVPK